MNKLSFDETLSFNILSMPELNILWDGEVLRKWSDIKDKVSDENPFGKVFKINKVFNNENIPRETKYPQDIWFQGGVITYRLNNENCRRAFIIITNNGIDDADNGIVKLFFAINKKFLDNPDLKVKTQVPFIKDRIEIPYLIDSEKSRMWLCGKWMTKERFNELTNTWKEK